MGKYEDASVPLVVKHFLKFTLLAALALFGFGLVQDNLVLIGAAVLGVSLQVVAWIRGETGLNPNRERFREFLESMREVESRLESVTVGTPVTNALYSHADEIYEEEMTGLSRSDIKEGSIAAKAAAVAAEYEPQIRRFLSFAETADRDFSAAIPDLDLGQLEKKVEAATGNPAESPGRSAKTLNSVYRESAESVTEFVASTADTLAQINGRDWEEVPSEHWDRLRGDVDLAAKLLDLAVVDPSTAQSFATELDAAAERAGVVLADRTRQAEYVELYAGYVQQRTEFERLEEKLEGSDRDTRFLSELRSLQDELRDIENDAREASLDGLAEEVAALAGDLGAIQRQLLSPGHQQETVQANGGRGGLDTDAPATPGGELPDHDVLEELGSGGNADVSKVELADLGEVAALKVPRFQGTLSADVIERFAEEAETWSRIDDHENVVSVRDSGTVPHPWILLQYMPGGSLDDRMDLLGLAESQRVLIDVCDGVHHAHRHGIVHNDLKPENVLFDDRGRPQVGDWGLAKALLDRSGGITGLTPAYAAPEQIDPERFGETDERTDIYQLGVVAYELLTGQRPFEGGDPAATTDAVVNDRPVPPSERTQGVPADVGDPIMTALATEKADRFETVVHFRDAVEDLEI